MKKNIYSVLIILCQFTFVKRSVGEDCSVRYTRRVSERRMGHVVIVHLIVTHQQIYCNPKHTLPLPPFGLSADYSRPMAIVLVPVTPETISTCNCALGHRVERVLGFFSNRRN